MQDWNLETFLGAHEKLVDLIKLLGAFTALATYTWSALRNHLILGLSVQTEKELAPTIRVTVTNSGPKNKAVDYAVLLIAPEELTLEQAIEGALSGMGREKQDLFQARLDNPKQEMLSLPAIAARGCRLVPLKELYQSQDGSIGPGEVVTCGVFLDAKDFRTGSEITLVVRLFVFVGYLWFPMRAKDTRGKSVWHRRPLYIRWRFTSDSLRLPAVGSRDSSLFASEVDC